MFCRFTNILTILTFVVHAVVGCCLHHAHASCHDEKSTRAASCQCEHTHHSPEASDSEDSDHDSEHNRDEHSSCEGNHCWLIADRCDQASSGQNFTEFCSLLPEILSDSMIARATLSPRDLAHFCPQAMSPPQLCARLGIWLI